MGRDRTKKHSIAVNGAWLPVPLEFLRSRACAELSPHAAKLLLDLMALLGPNATRNGDLSLAPKAMKARTMAVLRPRRGEGSGLPRG